MSNLNDLSEAIERLTQQMQPGGKVLRAWPLTGGVSAEVTAFELQLPSGHTERLIVRRHGDNDRQQNPQIAADEFRLLQVLQTAGVAAPRPRYLDQSCAVFPTPYLVIEFIEGMTEIASLDLGDCMRQLAVQLAGIHSVDAADLSFLPRQADRVDRWLAELSVAQDQSTDERRWMGILQAAWPYVRATKLALLHGDYWLGNALWQDGQLAAVIDWEDAALGDPLSDLANSRLELFWTHGNKAMLAFTGHYRALTAVDCTNLPWWDLWVALRTAPKISRWGLEADLERKMRDDLWLFAHQSVQRINESSRPAGQPGKG